MKRGINSFFSAVSFINYPDHWVSKRYSGAIDFLQDLDIVTGVINQEVRFPDSLSFELIKYIVNP